MWIGGAVVTVTMLLLSQFTSAFVQRSTRGIAAARGFVTSSSSAASSTAQRAAAAAATASDEKRSICVVGGGFGGLYTALKLSNLLKDKRDTEVVLIDPKDKFVFLPLLYELAVGSASTVEVCPRYDSLLRGSNVKFVRASVTDVNFKKNELKVVNPGTDTSSVMRYDQLVLAVGAQPRLDLAPGMREHALPFYRFEDAYELKLRLRALVDSKRPVIRVVVLGGGYSGVEVACNVAQYIGQDRAIITVVEKNSRILQNSPENNRDASMKALGRLGITVKCDTVAARVTGSAVTVYEKTTEGNSPEYDVDADLVLLTLGMELSPLVKTLGLPKDKLGRLSTDRTLQSRGKANVFVLGDCSGVEGEMLPSTAQVAMQQADIVAKNAAHRAVMFDQAEDLWDKASRPGELEKFRFVPLGEMITLGSAKGAITSMGGLVRLQGPLAALGRRVVYAARMPTRQQQVSALVNAGLSEAIYLRDRIANRIPFIGGGNKQR
jgi:NADH dehydrogenase